MPGTPEVDSDDRVPASCGIMWRHAHQVCGKPWIRTSAGPLPPMTACILTSPTQYYPVREALNVHDNRCPFN